MIGSAWMPCDRPIVGVAACSRARAASTVANVVTPAMMRSSARVVWIASAESSTSDDVIPRCSHRAGSPASSSTCVRNAIMSCRVVCSIVEIRSGSSLPAAAARTRWAVPLGTVPATSIASHAASSTSSHSSNRYLSSQSAASSGREYLPIMAETLYHAAAVLSVR